MTDKRGDDILKIKLFITHVCAKLIQSLHVGFQID